MIDALTAQIAIVDNAGNIVMTNRAWRDFAQANSSDPTQLAVANNYLLACENAVGVCGKEGPCVAAGIRGVLSGAKPSFSLEYACDSANERRWFVVRVEQLTGERRGRAIVAHENVTDRRAAEDRLRHESLHDALTDLPNRLLLEDRIQHCIARARREDIYDYAVLILDLDRFKVINDSLGHAAGDRLLLAVAERLRFCLRDIDTVSRPKSDIDTGAGSGTIARVGGDEFTLLLEGLRDPRDAVRIAERILAAVEQPLDFEGHELLTTASIGIAMGAPHYINGVNLLRDADVAMNRAKSCGKARYALFDGTMHELAVSRLRLESDLRRALERDELELHYQPIFSLDSNRPVGFEALLRWHRDGKLISPADFIPIAEDTGLIFPIGAWVLEEAARQLRAWRELSPAFEQMSMSVNLSRRQFADPGLVEHLRHVLDTTAIDPALLKLEITESVMILDTQSVAQILSRIRETGVRLSMDDFGTGYSSLSCLHRFPIDELKIDRAFIQDIPARPESAAVLQAIISLAHHLNIRVVAEGVESMEQVALLQTLSCDMAQGYLFARPLSADAAIRFITTAQVTEKVA